MISFFKKNFFVLLLLAIILIICLLNYTPETWLSGWDALHPEFNFPLNFQRILNGVWRSEQGLGAVAGHSHMADLPRQIILWFFSLILPLSFLRYFYFFLCLILGPLGVYFFLQKIIFKGKNKLFPFLGGLFYLFNLGTVQHFYVPFEMFATQYAALGWLFLFATQFLQNPSKKPLIFFALITFLATPQAYAATLWYVFFISLTIYLLAWLIINRLNQLKQSLVLISITLIINSFWLLPNLYYIFQHSEEVLNAKINQLFSQEAFLHNLEYGNLANFALFKNHLFSWSYFDFGIDKFTLLLKPWSRHLNQTPVLILGYFFFALIFLGVIITFFKKNKTLFPLVLIFIFSSIFLLNALPPSNYLFNFLRNQNSLFREALRFPFTKFSLILIFTSAIFFSYGLILKKGKISLVFLALFLSSSLVFFALPAFKGELINKKMRVKIPNEYFEAFGWFNQQEDGRVLQLPLHTFWGWEYYNWGFQGAGFIWFGVKQPFLTRDFDRWNLKNEKAYRELSYALYSQNLTLFEDLLTKYQIKYLLLDKSIFSPEHDKKVLFFEETEKLLASSSKISLINEFNFLKIYHFNFQEKKTYPEIINFENPPEEFKRIAEKKAEDYGQIDFDNFWLNRPSDFQIDFEKLDLKPALCGHPSQNQLFGLTIIQKKAFVLYGQNSLSCTKINLKEIIKERPFLDFLLKIDYESESEGEGVKFCLAKWGTDDCLKGEEKEGSLFFQFPQNRQLKDYEIRFLLETENQFEEKQALVKNVKLTTFPAKKSTPKEIVDNLDLEIKKNRYVSLKEEKRDSLAFPELPHNQSYALLMEAENESGLPLRVCLTNYTSKRCDLYTNLKDGLNIFFIPKTDPRGQGYDLNLSNLGIGPIQSINSLKSIKIVPLDYEFIKYQENPRGKIITNNQSYEKNWRAFEYQGLFKIKSLGEPVEVNGWMNGWFSEGEPKGKIVFFFLPQLLEYLGFLLILVLIALLAVF